MLWTDALCEASRALCQKRSAHPTLNLAPHDVIAPTGSVVIGGNRAGFRGG
jgi:hypothetical protein